MLQENRKTREMNFGLFGKILNCIGATQIIFRKLRNIAIDLVNYI